MLQDIERYIQQLPNTLIDKTDVIPNNCYVNITVENIARPDGWSTYEIVNTRPQLDAIPQGNLNGMMTNDQSQAVSNALNSAMNHVSDRQQFRAHFKDNTIPSKSANNSPNIQPQQPQQPHIIPLISVSQIQVNKQDHTEPDGFIDEMKILPMLEHDRIDILFRKLIKRLQPYCAKNPQEMAMFFMNYDHKQIIAALNDESILKELIQDINDEMKNYLKKPAQFRIETSIWNDKICQIDIKELIIITREEINKELKIFNDAFQKKNHLLKFIENNIRKIDHLRVDQLMYLISNRNKKTLI